MNSKPKLLIAPCSHEAAKYAVMKWHYSKRMPQSKIFKLGAWEDDVFIGAVLFSVGATRLLVKQYSLQPEQGCELVRVALGVHKYEVSRIVSVPVRILYAYNPHLRLIVSFADPDQRHVGTIYQAGNWVYTGVTSASPEYIVNGKRMHGRAFRHKYKGLEHDSRIVTVRGSNKHRYLYPLDADMRKQIEPLRKPYPKRAGSVDIDTPAIHAGEGGVNPTPALHSLESTGEPYPDWQEEKP